MNILMILANPFTNDPRVYNESRSLVKAGHKVTVANSTGTESKGMLGMLVKPDIRLDQVNSKDYDAVVFVGGTGAAVYFNDSRALNLAKEFFGEETIWKCRHCNNMKYQTEVICKECNGGEMDVMGISWQYHLKQMVLCDDAIKYIKNFRR